MSLTSSADSPPPTNTSPHRSDRAERARVSTSQAVWRKKRASVRYAAMIIMPSRSAMTSRSIAACASSIDSAPATTMAMAPHSAAPGRSIFTNGRRPPAMTR